MHHPKDLIHYYLLLIFRSKILVQASLIANHMKYVIIEI